MFLRSLGFGTNQEILDVFGNDPRLLATLEKDTAVNREEGLQELYRKLRPGEPVSVEGAETLLNNMLFDARRYDLAHVGIYKINKSFPSQPVLLVTKLLPMWSATMVNF